MFPLKQVVSVWWVFITIAHYKTHYLIISMKVILA